MKITFSNTAGVLVTLCFLNNVSATTTTSTNLRQTVDQTSTENHDFFIEYSKYDTDAVSWHNDDQSRDLQIDSPQSCIRVVDFQETLVGQVLKNRDKVGETMFFTNGVTVKARRSDEPADTPFDDGVIFDMGHPASNRFFSFRSHFDSSFKSHFKFLRNVFSIASYGSPVSGEIIVNFGAPVIMKSIRFIDIEEKGGDVGLFGSNDDFMLGFKIPTMRDGGQKIVTFQRDLVTHWLKIRLRGSGAIDDLTFQPLECSFSLPDFKSEFMPPTPAPFSLPLPSNEACIATSGSCIQDISQLKQTLSSAGTNEVIAICGSDTPYQVTDTLIITESKITLCCESSGSSSEVCVLKSSRRILDVTGESFTIRSIIFQDGEEAFSHGGNVRIEANGNHLIDSCGFYDGRADSGAFFLDGGRGGNLFIHTDGDVTIKDSMFVKGFATENGGAAFVIALGIVLIDNSKFLRNRSRAGGALFVEDADSLVVINSEFIQNEASTGGGFYIREEFGFQEDHPGQNITVVGSTFSENRANGGFGGGFYLSSALGELPRRTIIDSVFNENFAAIGGGAFYDNNYLLVGDEEDPVPTFLVQGNTGFGNLADENTDAFNCTDIYVVHSPNDCFKITDSLSVTGGILDLN